MIHKKYRSVPGLNDLNCVLSNVGEGLKYLRINAGYQTHIEFVKKHGLPSIQYWRMENGKSNITIKSLIKVLNIHRIGIDEFFEKKLQKRP